MADPNSIALAAAAESEGLQSVLVGGNAVNLYAYRRTTFDVDLLVRESDSQRWLTFFEQRGYRIFHRSANFIRLQFAADPTKALPVDLMLADEATFRKIRDESRRCDVAPGGPTCHPKSAPSIGDEIARAQEFRAGRPWRRL